MIDSEATVWLVQLAEDASPPPSHPTHTLKGAIDQVHSHTGRYDGFGVLAASAFKAVCESKGVPACDAGWESVKAQMSVMEGYSDVSPGLDALAANGFQLVAFSNSTLATLSSQLEVPNRLKSTQ